MRQKKKWAKKKKEKKRNSDKSIWKTFFLDCNPFRGYKTTKVHISP